MTVFKILTIIKKIIKAIINVETVTGLNTTVEVLTITTKIKKFLIKKISTVTYNVKVRYVSPSCLFKKKINITRVIRKATNAIKKLTIKVIVITSFIITLSSFGSKINKIRFFIKLCTGTFGIKVIGFRQT